MSKKDLKREPFSILDQVWWYEEMKGIEIHIDTEQVITNREGHMTIIIPWVQLRKSLERKDK